MSTPESALSLAATKTPSTARTILSAGVPALLAWATIPAASTSPDFLLVLEWGVLALTAVYLLMSRRPVINPHLAASLRTLRVFFIGAVAFAAAQLVPLPAFFVRLVSPATYAFRQSFAPGGAGAFLPISLAPASTAKAALELATYVLFGWLVVRTVNHGNRMKALVAVLAGTGVFQALYGLFNLSLAHPRLLFYPKVYNLDSATGTFVNRNHFSGFLEMVVPLTIGLIIARLDFFALGGRGLRDRLVQMSAKGAAQNLLLALAVVVMSLGVLFSRSRSGVVVLGLTFLLFLLLIVFHFTRGGDPRQRWARNFVRGTLAAVTALALLLGVGATIQRFSLDNLLHEGRPATWSNTARIVHDFPLFGTGLGTFVTTYPAYETMDGPELVMTHAHNDYLEILSELGIAGFVLLVGGILISAWTAFRVWRGRHDPESKGLALGGIVAICGMLLHSLTDFNLHIPANALLFAATLGLTLAAAFHKKR